MKHPLRRITSGVGRLACVSALLFTVNSLFADAVSTTRIETYKSNRLLPSTQTAESLENLQFNPTTCSWTSVAKSAESNAALYEAMSSEDWANFDLSLESNPNKAKEGMEWLLSEYLWGDKCKLTASEIAELSDRFRKVNGDSPYDTGKCITLEIKQNTSLDVIKAKLIDTGIMKAYTGMDDSMVGNTERLWVIKKGNMTPGQNRVIDASNYQDDFYFYYSRSDAWEHYGNGRSYPKIIDMADDTITEGDYLAFILR